MKLITLLIIAATLNITLLSKNNNLTENVSPTKVVKINYNPVLLSKPNRAEYIDSIKQKLFTHLNNYKKQLVNILIKTHIITIIEAKSPQNFTVKPKSKPQNRKNEDSTSELETIQKT